MASLLAQGSEPDWRWQRRLPDGLLVLGRSERQSDWAVPWDLQISRRHATLQWQGGALSVSRCAGSRNEIYHHGRPVEECRVAVGEEFQIGGTTFRVQEGDPELEDEFEDFTSPPTEDEFPVPPAPAPEDAEREDCLEITLSPEELQQLKFHDAGQRIEVLSELPELIRDSPSETELNARVVEILLQGIPRADVAAVVWLDADRRGEVPEVQIRAWRERSEGVSEFRPSRRLICDTIQCRRQSVLHLWGGGDQESEFTRLGFLDWAICSPLPDEPAHGWALYVAGSLKRAIPGLDAPLQRDVLKTDLKFTELVASIYGSLRQVRDLQNRQNQLAGFLSRPVLAAIACRDIDEVLRPRETEVTVLFCDLRGSCRIAEESRNELAELWDRVGEALNIMTSSIIDRDGVIGDFQGDAAMGFWGWPLACEDQVERATRAALTIWRRFSRAALKPSNPLAGFHCGIGIANGRAIAGRLGTADQFKVSVYGPIVNLAARLETMTKVFRVPILVDEPTVTRLNASDNRHWVRSRRLARVQPYGMRTVLTVSELLPPDVEPGAMSERHRRDYEAAFEAFTIGNWQDARRLLQRLPDDYPGQFLLRYLERHQNRPPEGWDGTIVMDAK